MATSELYEDRLWLTIPEAAVSFNVNRRTVHEWVQAGCPARDATVAENKSGGKMLHQAKLARWLLDRAKNAASTADAAELKLRKLRAEAEIAERDAAMASGDAVSVADVEADWQNRTATVRGRILQMPSALGSRVAAESDAYRCEEMIRAACEDALRELAGVSDEGFSEAEAA